MILALAVTLIVALSALLLSIVAVFQAKSLLQASQHRNTELRSRQEARLDAVQSSIDALGAEVRGLEGQPAGPMSVKPGLNLSKRSQALRMHRRGEAPAQIAAALNIPSQEVELLIKVQRIVLSNMQSKAASQK
jgi:hypothetical protein